MDKLLSTLRKKNIISLLFIVFVTTFAFLNLNYIVLNKVDIGVDLNKAGEQKMISQKIVLHAIKYKNSRELKDKLEILELSDQMLQNHTSLTKSGVELEVYSDEELRLDKQIRDFSDNAKKYATTLDALAFEHLFTQHEKILEDLDSASKMYEIEFIKNQNRYLIISSTVFVLIMVIAIFIYLLLIKPTNRTIDEMFTKLKNSELRIKELIDFSPLIIYAKDIEGSYLFANQNFKKTFSVNREIDGLKDSDIFEDNRIDEIFLLNKRALNENRVVREIKRVDYRDRIKVYDIITFPLKDGGGEVYGICSISIDNTEQKSLEEENRIINYAFDALQSMLNIGSSILDLKNRELKCSKELCNILRVDPNKIDLNYNSFLGMVHSEDLESLLYSINRAIDEGVNFEIDYRVILNSGESINIHQKAKMYKDEKGANSLLISIHEDVTNKKENNSNSLGA